MVGNSEEGASLANEIAYLVFKTGDIGRSLKIFEEHADDFLKIKNPMIVSNIRFDVVLAAAGKIDRAWDVFNRKKKELAGASDPRVTINLMTTEAFLRKLQGEATEEKKLYEQALDLCKKNRIYSPQEGLMENLKDITLETPKEKSPVRPGPAAAKASEAPAVAAERLFEVLEDLSSEEELQKLLEKAVDYAIDLTGGLRGFILLKKEGGEGVPEFELKVARNLKTPQEGLPISFTFLRKVFQTGRAMVTLDASSDPDLRQMQSVTQFDLRSIICAPLKIKNKNIGVLYIDHPLESGLFSDAQLKDLEVLAHQAALAVDKVQEIVRLKKSEDILKEELRKSSDLLALSEQELEKLKSRLRQAQGEMKTRFRYEGIIAQSPQMTKILQTLDKLTNTHVPIFIYG